MPMLAVTTTLCRRDVRAGQGVDTRVASRLALLERFDRACRMTNSSPPKREITSASRIAFSAARRRLRAACRAGVTERYRDLLELSRSMSEWRTVSARHFVERAFHAVAQHNAVGQPGQGIEARQMIDLRLAIFRSVMSSINTTMPPFSIGWTVNSSVRPFIRSKGSGIVRRGKPRVEMMIMLCARSRQQSGFDGGLDHLAHAQSFSSRSLASPSCCFSLPFDTTTRRLESNMHSRAACCFDRRVEALGEERHVARGHDASSSVLRSRSR